MTDAGSLLLIGASVRAAAFSALRAGFSPWCIDLFADSDLAAACPSQRLTTRYPDGFAALLERGPPGPWMYTGGLENHSRLVDRLARQRPLWGNKATALQRCRDPLFVSRILRNEGLPVPEIITTNAIPKRSKRWLVKPLRGAGGAGIRYSTPGQIIRFGEYLQEYIEGEACSAVFVGAGLTTRLLGMTRQLVGVEWLHARPFHYCGSVGPLSLSAALSDQLNRLGCTLARECNLAGLFGVDGILREGLFWPVEVNPRYTATVEVIEYATGVSALAWHRLACTGHPLPAQAIPLPDEVVGKAILFTTKDIVVSSYCLGQVDLRLPLDSWRLPVYADIPAVGSVVRARQPVLTTFASGMNVQLVLAALRQKVGEVDGALRKG